jgi:hypothetical protein|tara:strand:- start:539 stop:784 length:246 start_codon:yes stop_codon:yes gene_type:complete
MQIGDDAELHKGLPSVTMNAAPAAGSGSFRKIHEKLQGRPYLAGSRLFVARVERPLKMRDDYAELAKLKKQNPGKHNGWRA